LYLFANFSWWRYLDGVIIVRTALILGLNMVIHHFLMLLNVASEKNNDFFKKIEHDCSKIWYLIDVILTESITFASFS